MTPELQGRIDKLLKSARNARDAKNPAQREAAIGFMEKRAAELQRERDELEARLAARWDALDANPKHQNAAGREQRTIDLLHDYEALCDALNAALSTWLDHEEEAA